MLRSDSASAGGPSSFGSRPARARIARSPASAGAGTTSSTERPGWVAVAQLTPERSLPLSGFSIPLRQTEDSERFRFTFPLHGDAELPVHILFSRSEGRAEVKAADMKVFEVEGVRLPTDARRRWISWWRERRPAMGTFFPPPRRVGRLPVARPPRRPIPATPR